MKLGLRWAFDLKMNIDIQDFLKVDIRVGKVLGAKDKKGSSKLIRLKVDFGDNDPRIIFTAVREFGYTADFFENKKFLFVTNLKPKKIMDEESNGMILAVDDPKTQKPVFIKADNLPLGAFVK